MRIGYQAGYWGAGPPEGAGKAFAQAERLGFESVWTAEAYGSDALTPLAWWGSTTSRVLLGTCVAQMAARSPAAAAMAAMTLDHLSGGRFVLGLGVSGPQVVQAWHGQPFDKPLERTREYIARVRAVVARQRVPDAAPPGGTNPSGRTGRALRSTLHPVRPDLPVHLAAEGQRNIALTAEIADGWLAAFIAPRLDAHYRELLGDGFEQRSEALSPPERFEVSATVPVRVDDDVERAVDALRPWVALYVGGMGSATTNFHRDAVARLGYEEAAREIQTRYLAGDRAGAAAAVPTELVDDVALVGPAERIRERLAAWERTVVTRLLVQCPPTDLPQVADALVLATNADGPAT